MNLGVGVSLSDDPNHLITARFPLFSSFLSISLSLSLLINIFLFVCYVHDEQIFPYFYLKVRTENETLMVIRDRIMHNATYITLNILPFLCYLFPLTMTFVVFISISIYSLQAYNNSLIIHSKRIAFYFL